MLFVIKLSKILTKIYIFIKIYFRTIEIFAKKNLTIPEELVRFL